MHPLFSASTKCFSANEGENYKFTIHGSMFWKIFKVLSFY